MTTSVAGFIRGLILDLGHGGSGPGHRLSKGLIELLQHGHPLPLATGDLIQTLFHLCRESDIDDFGEVLLEHIGHDEPQFQGLEMAAALAHITPLLNGGKDGGIGAGASNAILLQRLDQGGLGIAWRGLGEMLLWLQPQKLELLTHGELGQGMLIFLFLLVLALAIEDEESGKQDDRARGSEQIFLPRWSLGCYVYGSALELSLSHLAGHHPAPNEPIELKLIGIQVRLDQLRLSPN